MGRKIMAALLSGGEKVMAALLSEGWEGNNGVAPTVVYNR
jgi:hypothetical protein